MMPSPTVTTTRRGSLTGAGLAISAKGSSDVSPGDGGRFLAIHSRALNNHFRAVATGTRQASSRRESQMAEDGALGRGDV